jgi:WD40 repeat protein
MSISRALVPARFSPNGLFVATASEVGTNLWDARDGRLLATNEYVESVTDVVFSSESSTLVSSGVDGASRFWPIPNPLACSVSRLEKISHLVAGHRADSQDGLQPLSPSEAIELLQQVSSLQID